MTDFDTLKCVCNFNVFKISFHKFKKQNYLLTLKIELISGLVEVESTEIKSSVEDSIGVKAIELGVVILDVLIKLEVIVVLVLEEVENKEHVVAFYKILNFLTIAQ